MGLFFKKFSGLQAGGSKKPSFSQAVFNRSFPVVLAASVAVGTFVTNLELTAFSQTHSQQLPQQVAQYPNQYPVQYPPQYSTPPSPYGGRPQGYPPNPVPGYGYPGQPAGTLPAPGWGTNNGGSPYSSPGGYMAAPSQPYSPPRNPSSPSAPFGTYQAPPNDPSSSYAVPPSYAPDTDEFTINQYNNYTDQANKAIQQGRLTDAIQWLEKAIPIAPEQSKAAIYNNLAAVYIRQGNDALSRLKSPQTAAKNYRRALFLLNYGWPEKIAKKQLNLTNEKIAADNLQNAFQIQHFNAKDKAKHMELAKSLRAQGLFQEAIVEYGEAQKLDQDNPDALRGLGDLFNVMNNAEKAKKYYKKLIAVSGGNAPEDVYVRLGNAQNRAGEANEAIKTLNQALDKYPDSPGVLNILEAIWRNEIRVNPNNVIAHANLGSIFQKSKNYPKALQAYSNAETLSNQNPATSIETKKMIRLNLGTLYQVMGQFDKATQAYDTVLTLDPNNKQALVYKAALYKDSGRIPDAMNVYSRLLAGEPDNEQYQIEILTLIKKQPAPPAKIAADLQAFADRTPNSAAIQANVGEVFHEMKDLPRAITYYQRAIALNPKLTGVYANLGAALQANGQTQQALDAFKMAEKLDPKSDTLKSLVQQTESSATYEVFQRALDFQNKSQWEAAIQEYQKGLAMDPKNAPMRANYALTLQQANRLEAAIQEYQKVIAQEPNQGQYYYYLGTVYHQKQQWPEAIKAYEKAVSLDPSLTDARKNLADIKASQTQTQAIASLNQSVDYYTRKQYPLALQTVQKALQLDPGNATGHYYKGLILNALTRPREAIASYREATRLNPEMTDAFYALAIALDAQKDTASAKVAFQRFVDLASKDTTADSETVKYAQERLKTL